MSVAIKIADVVKRHGENTTIPELSLHIQEGEFFTLLGPSGCGKTTLLRMIAGFNSIEGGTISFNDDVVNDRPPKDRNIGMVFQNYAVFPQMTVGKNVGFGLTNRRTPKGDIAAESTRCSTRSTSPSSRTGCRPTCREASSSASRSRGRS